MTKGCSGTELVFWVSGDIWKYICISKDGVRTIKTEKAQKIKDVPTPEKLRETIKTLNQKLKTEFNSLKEIIGEKGKRSEKREKEEKIINMRNKIRLLEQYLRVLENPLI